MCPSVAPGEAVCVCVPSVGAEEVGRKQGGGGCKTPGTLAKCLQSQDRFLLDFPVPTLIDVN